MPRYLDITRPIYPGMPVYPGNPEVVFEQVAEATKRSSALTSIALGSHTGTHIDAPSHIEAGNVGTGLYELGQLTGPCEVVDVSGVASVVTGTDMPKPTSERVLLKTRNSLGDATQFDEEFVALDESAARDLVQGGVRLVGIDGPSIKKRGQRDRVHELLLMAGVIILEGLWLAEASAGHYELLCLPLKIDSDGAPTRAVLRTLED